MSIFANIEPEISHCMPERRFWCAVFRDAIRRSDHRFFHERGGVFSRVCDLMSLPEEEIRNQVCS